MPLKIAIFASGNGSNAQAIINKIQEGILSVQINLVFSDKPGAKVLERAGKAGISVECFESKSFASREAFDLRLVDLARRHGCEAIALAGYMRILSPAFLNEFKDRVINIHPALLPAFPGMNGVKDAVEYGVKLLGPTVHIVNEQVDSGPIIIQGAIPCEGNDFEALKKRALEVEHRIYPQALQWIAEGRIQIQGRKTILAQASKKLARAMPDCLVWPPLEEGF